MALPFSVTFALTRQDYWEAFRLAQHGRRRLLLALRGAITALILLAFGLTLWLWQQRNATYCQLEATFGVAVTFALRHPFIVLLLLLIPMIWLQLLERGILRFGLSRVPSAFQERVWEFSEEGVRIKAPTASSDVKWEYFTGWRENEAYFLVMHGKSHHYAIPKRSMSGEDRDSLKKLFQAHIHAGTG